MRRENCTLSETNAKWLHFGGCALKKGSVRRLTDIDIGTHFVIVGNTVIEVRQTGPAIHYGVPARAYNECC